jgi:hypothetical protein
MKRISSALDLHDTRQGTANLSIRRIPGRFVNQWASQRPVRVTIRILQQPLYATRNQPQLQEQTTQKEQP